MAQPTPFKINVPEAKIQRLKQKLALTDWPTEVDDTPWKRGPPLSDIKRMADRWQNGYDWRKAEAHLNTFPQYTTPITIDNFGTYNIHFIHQRSTTTKNAIPLLFVHGWPGSFIEVTKILSHLTSPTSPTHPSFHVVAPSLINFGFSSECLLPNFRTDQHAETCHKLMLSLGYPQYVTQGGDLGYFTTHIMARLYPDHLKAWHVNMALPSKPEPQLHPSLHAQWQSHTLTPRETSEMAHNRHVAANMMGYYQMQATKPALVSLALTDSPIACLSWIYDALYTWSDHTTYKWTDDEVLTWISIYLFGTGGPAASVRIYHESRNMAGSRSGEKGPVKPKLGVAHFPVELAMFPRLWYGTLAEEVVQQTEFEQGGHFAAWEQPEALVGDLRRMFGKGGGAEGVVEGCCGYDDGDVGAGKA